MYKEWGGRAAGGGNGSGLIGVRASCAPVALWLTSILARIEPRSSWGVAR
jgi:hypothetical protein